MGYEGTTVPLVKSQGQIRKMVFAHKGTAVGFFTEPPFEGFSCQLTIDEKPYTIRISAKLNSKRQREMEEMRIWRVLYHHLKTIFEAADSGVMEIREMILPYVVTKSGKTIAEMILPQLEQAVEGNPARLLGGGR
jgi:hypothetical protein